MVRNGRIRNQPQLVTYPDSLGKNLRELSHVLSTYIGDAIGGVHVLPFYPSSADRGFAPLTHLSVDPKFGTWQDIRTIADKYDFVADLIVNHLSCASSYFQDYLERGAQSKYAHMFLDVDVFLERHGVTLDALRETYRPRPTMPYTEFRFKDGQTRTLWTTFTHDQVDLDLTQPVTRNLILRFIERLTEHGVKLLRLDAVGYAIKKPWTTSFLIPETYEFMRWVRDITPEHVAVLAELHHDYKRQRSLLSSGVIDWIYDFSLPLLVLHALYSKNSNNLKHWISIRPARQINTLDTHDGIGVVDVQGLLTKEDIDATVDQITLYGGNHLYRASGEYSQNLDIYQINTTYFSALGEDDDAYIAARAIQFFIPGIPQVYYVGLLAGSNDLALLEQTNNGRDVNRHNFTLEEVDEAMERTVVQRLLQLMKLRSSHPAFDGTFTLLPTDIHLVHLRWQLDDLYCEARVDLEKRSVELEYVNPSNGRVEVKRC